MGLGGFTDGAVTGFLPWRLAAAWGNPDKGRKNDVLGRLANVRSWLGIVVVIAVNIYAGSRDVDDMLNDELWVKTLYNVMLAVCLLPAAMILVFALTKREYRRELRWWPVFRSIGLMILTGLLPLLGFVYLANWLSGIEKPQYRYSGSDVQIAVGVILLLLGGVAVYQTARRVPLRATVSFIAAVCLGPVVTPLLVMLVLVLVVLLIMAPIVLLLAYVSCVAYWASRTCCWVGSFHPLLTPPMAAIVVTTFTVVSLANADTNGVPMAVWLWLTFGGLVSTLAVAAAEWVLLRKRGYRYRYGPTHDHNSRTQPIYLNHPIG